MRFRRPDQVLLHPPRPRLFLSVGVTGHRPPLIERIAADGLRKRLEPIFETLARATNDVFECHSAFFAAGTPVLRLVTPLAEGADQLASEAALVYGYEVQAVLPLPRADYRRDFDPDGAETFDSLLDRACCILEFPALAAGRDAGYALAGRATLAHCDVLIALWDGAPARGRGGTAEVVAAALRRGIPVVHVSPSPEVHPVIRWANYDPLGEPEDVEATPARDLTDASLAELTAMLLAPPDDPCEREFAQRFFNERQWRMRPRAEYPLLLAAMGVKRLRRSAFRSRSYADETRDEWRPFRDACAERRDEAAPVLDPIETAYSWADRLAQHFAQTYRSGHVLNFMLAAAAVLLALSGLLFSEFKLWLAIAELGAVAGFVSNTRVGITREWHRRWLDYRHLAERLRPMRSLKLLGAASPPPGHGPGQPDRWLDWYAGAVWRASGCLGGTLTDPTALARLIVREELQPQLDYHRAAAIQMHLLDHRLHQLGMVLFIASLAGCFVFIGGYLVAYGWVRANAAAFVALSAGLPALGSAIFGIRVQGDYRGSAERSRATADNLGHLVEAINKETDLARLVVLVERAATTMLLDLAEWRLAYERKQLELPA